MTREELEALAKKSPEEIVAFLANTDNAFSTVRPYRRTTGTPIYDNNTTKPTFNVGPLEYYRKIGNVSIELVHRSRPLRPLYVVTYCGRTVGSAFTVSDALRTARTNVPRPPRRVHEEILAVRGWKLRGDLLTPCTQTDNETWSGVVASVPDFEIDSYNGLYCVKPDTTYIRKMLSEYEPDVYGIIGLLGRVVEYERGYRAERAVVRMLTVRIPQVSDGLLRLLEDRYQCPVRRE